MTQTTYEQKTNVATLTREDDAAKHPSIDVYCLSCLPDPKEAVEKQLEYCDPCRTNGKAYASVNLPRTPEKGCTQIGWDHLGETLLQSTINLCETYPEHVNELYEDTQKKKKSSARIAMATAEHYA